MKGRSPGNAAGVFVQGKPQSRPVVWVSQWSRNFPQRVRETKTMVETVWPWELDLPDPDLL